MSPAAQFLISLSKALSAMALYKEGHPARDRAIHDSHDALSRLQEDDPAPRFTFLGDEVIYRRRPLSELKAWDWGPRLSAVGAQMIEVAGPVPLGEFEVFLDELQALLSDTPLPTAEVRQTRETTIRWGAVGLKGTEGGEGDGGEMETATLSFSLREEADTVTWLHEELRDRKQLHLLEAEAIVRSMSVAMHGDQQFLIPLLKLKRFDQYTTTHAMNVSVLAMALAEHVGCGAREVRAFGIAGLLHDLGKVTIPEEILNKPGKLDDNERAIMNGHTTAGARMIMETEQNLDLAAVVAYEHHIRLDGGGYPTLAFPRPCHQASNMVHICDVFDALRTDRPYRGAWEQERVLELIRDGAGTEFDGELARAFVDMMETYSDRVAILNSEDEVLPLPEEAAPTGEEAPEGSAPGSGEGE